MTESRSIDALTPIDLARQPVWEFVNDDSQPDETGPMGGAADVPGRILATIPQGE